MQRALLVFVRTSSCRRIGRRPLVGGPTRGLDFRRPDCTLSLRCSADAPARLLALGRGPSSHPAGHAQADHVSSVGDRRGSGGRKEAIEAVVHKASRNAPAAMTPPRVLLVGLLLVQLLFSVNAQQWSPEDSQFLNALLKTGDNGLQPEDQFVLPVVRREPSGQMRRIVRCRWKLCGAGRK
uniref:Uncharacterized protein n=1 Tax=Plectus sambesii TaxID=2011161 RepID=A0A914V0V3_9BILA